MKCYDRGQRRLVYFQEKATEKFWDERWKARDGGLRQFSSKKVAGRYSLVARTTKKYLRPDDGPILEGGCGLGGNVVSLASNGFECIGIDYARDTVERISQYYPDLDIRYGDIRKLDFKDKHFVGYWSLGVIEHFWDGYQDIVAEMFRVLRPGGYLFLTFPAMNTARRIKAWMKRYEELSSAQIDDFYQFALDNRTVVRNFEQRGFQLVSHKRISVLHGLQDEVQVMRPLVNFILKHRLDNKLTGVGYHVINNMADYTLGAAFGHMSLLVLRKK